MHTLGNIGELARMHGGRGSLPSVRSSITFPNASNPSASELKSPYLYIPRIYPVSGSRSQTSSKL
jgi:hypothetical protein